MRSVLRFSPSIAAALIWLPRVAAKGHLDQRPLHLGDHPVVDVGRREAVGVGGEELPDVPLDRRGQRLGRAGAVGGRLVGDRRRLGQLRGDQPRR